MNGGPNGTTITSVDKALEEIMNSDLPADLPLSEESGMDQRTRNTITYHEAIDNLIKSSGQTTVAESLGPALQQIMPEGSLAAGDNADSPFFPHEELPSMEESSNRGESGLKQSLRDLKPSVQSLLRFQKTLKVGSGKLQEIFEAKKKKAAREHEITEFPQVDDLITVQTENDFDKVVEAPVQKVPRLRHKPSIPSIVAQEHLKSLQYASSIKRRLNQKTAEDLIVNLFTM